MAEGAPRKPMKVSIRHLHWWGIWDKTTGELLHVVRAKHEAESWARQNGVTNADIHQITQTDVSGLMGGRRR